MYEEMFVREKRVQPSKEDIIIKHMMLYVLMFAKTADVRTRYARRRLASL